MRAWKLTAGENAISPTRDERSNPSLHTRSGVVWSKYSNPVTQNASSSSSARALTWPPMFESHPSRYRIRRAAAILNGRSVRIRVLLHRHRHGEVEETRCVLPGELAHVVGGEPDELLAQELLRVGPGAVLVRVVGLEADVLEADPVPLLEAGAVLDGTEPEVALQHLGGGQVDAVPRAVHVLVALHVVEPIEQTRDPADAALGEADAEVGEAHREARVEPVH